MKCSLKVNCPVPLGLAYVLLVETNPFPNLSLFFRTMLFENPSVLSRFCFLHDSLVCKYNLNVLLAFCRAKRARRKFWNLTSQTCP